jgi:hypothetical protein
MSREEPIVMDVMNESFDKLAVAQLRERKDAMERQRQIQGELKRLGDLLNGLASSLRGDEISSGQVLHYVEALRSQPRLVDAAALAAEIEAFQERKQRIADLNAALAQLL